MKKLKQIGNALTAGMESAKTMYAAKRAAGVGIVSAVGLAVSHGAVHAQVTFSATAPQDGLEEVVEGGTTLFWDNAPGIFLTVIAIGVVFSLGYMLYRALRRRG